MLKIGDVVANHNGGLLMTIESLNENKANCVWFDNKILKRDQIEIKFLIKHFDTVSVNDDEKLIIANGHISADRLEKN